MSTKLLLAYIKTMQQNLSIDKLTELFRDIDETDYNKDHIFLLLNPSIDQYLDFIKSLYKYSNSTVPSNDLIPIPVSDLLNYTYIGQSLANKTSNSCIEIYTILGNVLENSIFIMDTLKSRSETINVFLFEDCNSSDLTVKINSFIHQDLESTKEYIKANILPFLQNHICQFINYFSTGDWKSATILFSNVSKWTYNTITIPIVDFIQQYIRRLLLECKIPCQLVYLPSSLKNNEEKLILLINQLMEAKLLKPPEDQDISYMDLHFVASFDSVEKIQLLDESFSWSEWRTS